MPYSRSDILNQNTSDFPNNNSGQITPAILRDFNANFVNSVQFIGDPTDSASYAATASIATSASYANNATLAATASLLLGSVVSASYAATASVAISASYANNATSASYSNNSTSASYALTASFALNGGGGTIDTGSFATTGSNNFIGDQIITGSFKVDFTGNTGNPLVDISTGSISLNANQHTPITLFTQDSGVINITSGGSNPRNNVNIDGKINQQEPGSTPNSLKDTNITGSLNAPSITGSLQGTASYATQALTASFALNVPTIDTGSFATTGSNTFTGSQTINGNLLVYGVSNFISGSGLQVRGNSFSVENNSSVTKFQVNTAVN